MTINKDFLLLLKSNGMGEGEPDLDEKLLKAFLNMLLESGQAPAQIVFMRSGVFLTTEGSYALEVLKQFEGAGTEILSCGTCLDYYGRKDKLVIGKPTNMRDTVAAMLSFAKVISL